MMLALGAVLVMSLSNGLDSFLSNSRFKNGLTLALFCAFLNIVFIPIVAIIDPPGVPPLSIVPIFLAASLLDVLFLIPYFKAMQVADTSVVTALFGLTRIFTPILAYWIVDERLTAAHYIGFILIAVGGIALTINPRNLFKLHKVFWLMLSCCLMVSLNSVLYKYQLERVSWGTSMIWGSLYTVPWLLIISLGLPKIRKQMEESWSSFRSSWHIILANEAITFTSISMSMYAIFLVPVSQASSIWGVQPFVVLGLAHLLSWLGIRGMVEDVTTGSTVKKVLLFAVMLVGVALVRE